VHLGEGLLSTKQSALWILVTSPVLVAGYYKFKKFIKNETTRNKALLQMLTALLFALTMFPIPVPVIGVTSHMCMTPLFAIVLGPLTTIIPAFLVLLLQAAFLGHGGISNIGANLFTLGIVGPVIATGLFYFLKTILNRNISLFIAILIGSLSVYIADALILSSALTGSESFSFWMSKVLLALAPIQIPVSLIEAAMALFIIRSFEKRDIFNLNKNSYALVVLLLVAFSISPIRSNAQEVDNGLDKVVFEQIAVTAGKEPKEPLWAPTKEVSEALMFLILLMSGFVVGYNWIKITKIRE
jgi:cobalt/nickel transport system permease protein